MTEPERSCRRLWLIYGLSAFALLASPALALAVGLPATVLKIQPSSVVVSPRISSLPQASWAKAPQDLKLIPAPLHPAAHGPAPGQPSPSDHALQTTAGPRLRIEPKTSFSGLGENGAIPPDPNIAVGKQYVVQTVNLDIGIWDKNTGALLPGYPKKLGSLWTGVSGCDTSNSDPVVQYDNLAPDGLNDGGTGRWLISQIGPLPTSTYFGPFSECIAVSTTSNPAGSYYVYQYKFNSDPNTGIYPFDDYPKISVWPTKSNSAYAASFNIFDDDPTLGTYAYSGNFLCDLNRDALLSGATHPLMSCLALWNNSLFSGPFYSFLPAGLDGTTPPPDGTPAYFLTMGTSSSLLLYGVKPDFTDPSNPTITVSGPFTISVDSYTPTCGDGGSCVPQPSTSQQLASLGDRLMYRLAYRNFGNGHAAMVVNHSVATGSGIGVRWYELDATGNTSQPFTVAQQGTFAGSPPDSAYRWMGSAAMDAAGDIALGYSKSSSSIYPEIAFTGQLVGDPLNTMGSETVLQPGNGSQTGYARWGDYTALRIDPSDDTTFWYTDEYYKATSAYQWSTYIGSFKLASGSSASTYSLTVGVTGSGTVTSSPAGINCSSGTCSTSFASGTTVSLTESPASGWTFGGWGGACSGTGACSVTMNAAESVTAKFTQPPSSGIALSLSPSSLILSRKGSGGYQASGSVTVDVTAPSSTTVGLSVSGLPSNASASFTPSSTVTGSGYPTLNITLGPHGNRGTFPVSVIGTDPNNSQDTDTTTLDLTVMK